MDRGSKATVVFSNRAYLGIVAETYEKVETETGGILLGKYLNGIWYVLECLDPGPKSIFRPAYFEYDTPYVTHLANKIARFYKYGLELVGLWHRHPGSYSAFSSTDDSTNVKYAALNSIGAISALVNLDPSLRLTVFHVSLPLRYTQVQWAVSDVSIPNEIRAQKQLIDFVSDNAAHPSPPAIQPGWTPPASLHPARPRIVDSGTQAVRRFGVRHWISEQCSACLGRRPTRVSPKHAQTPETRQLAHPSAPSTHGTPVVPAPGSADDVLKLVESEVAFLESQTDMKASMRLLGDELVVHVRAYASGNKPVKGITMAFGISPDNKAYVKVDDGIFLETFLYEPGFVRRYLATLPLRNVPGSVNVEA